MRLTARPIPSASNAAIAKEWDAIADLRAQQIKSGQDISMTSILLPAIRTLLTSVDRSSLLDVGCGTGYVTSVLARDVGRVVAVDISARSISRAQRDYGQDANLRFIHSSVERYAARTAPGSFSVVVANMTLMTSVNLRTLLRSVSKLLSVHGHFVFTITHPWFWPDYWGYASAKWFRYSEEIIIKAPFRISSMRAPSRFTTHVHRPLGMYSRELGRVGLGVELILEPLPSPELEAAYPKPWKHPRFLAARCTKWR